MTVLRSFLFIPADSDKKLSKIAGCGADAVIIDLEDSVAPSNKPSARAKAVDYLTAHPFHERQVELWVRINPLSSGLALDDLTAVMSGRPNGIMLPKADSPDDVERLSYYLDAFEAVSAIDFGSTLILPVVTETAIAPFKLGDYAERVLPRLYGLTWGAEDLSAALSASTNLDETGQWASTYKLVRSLTLLAAHAAGVQAVETVYVDFRDTDGLSASSKAARAEGFSGRMAIHPAQVEPINAGFMPSGDEVDFAKRVVEAFNADPGAGVVGLDGKMLDIPHLKAAQKTLELADRFLN